MTIPSGRWSAERASFLTHLMLGGSLIQQPSSEHRPHRCEIYRFHSVEVVGRGGGLTAAAAALQGRTFSLPSAMRSVVQLVARVSHGGTVWKYSGRSATRGWKRIT